MTIDENRRTARHNRGIEADVSVEMKRVAGQVVEGLQAMGLLRSPQLRSVFSQVPRHMFVPDAAPELAYVAHKAVEVKNDAAGRAMSTAYPARGLAA